MCVKFDIVYSSILTLLYKVYATNTSFKGKSMYVLIDFGGKQQKAQKGDTLTIDKVKGKAGDTFTVETVVLTSDGDNVVVGTPYVKGAKVTLEIKDVYRDKKLIVFKHESKKDFHRTIGHRQEYTTVVVKDISVA